MAHNVKCYYCDQSFDRDEVDFVQINSRRYAHAKCAVIEAKKNNKPIPEVISPKNMRKCKICGKFFDYTKVPHVKKFGSYFHAQGCWAQDQARERTDKERLEEYIMELWDTDYIHPSIRKQINQYVEEYHYTYSGIQKTLQYLQEVQKVAFDINVYSIGKVPYYYMKAKEYYYAIWKASQQNSSKPIAAYKPKTIKIEIPPPKRNIPKKKLFSFLDDEEEET